MNVKVVSHEVRLQQWSKIIQECRSSGTSIKAWCAEKQINIKTYYYWQKKVCQETCQNIELRNSQHIETVPASNNLVFAEIDQPTGKSGQVAAILRRGNIEVEIYCGADSSIVESALLAFKSL